MFGSDIEARLNIMRGSSILSPDALLDMIINMNSDSGFVQVFDSNRVINKLHLQAAYINAVEAFSEGTNISSKLYIESLLFAAMTRQIVKATSMFRVRDTGNFAIASNRVAALGKIKGFARLSDFRTSKERELETAKTFGIESDYEHLNQRILQKMAISRIQD